MTGQAQAPRPGHRRPSRPRPRRAPGRSSRRNGDRRLGPRRVRRHVSDIDVLGVRGAAGERDTTVDSYFETWGERDRERGLPMRRDTVFRIYSMSKPVTSVAVMILYEEGRFFLRDPVGKYLPELAAMRVVKRPEDVGTPAGEAASVAAKRPITIRDLLRHTAGLTYGFIGDTAVDQLYREQGILVEQTHLGELVAGLGTIPLLYEPGSRWHYSVATDVLGRLVEVVSGQSFEAFLEERIFEPLGMKDTSFTLSAEEAGRLAQLYSPEGTGEDADLFLRSRPSKALEVAPERFSAGFQEGATFQSGGGGLLSTAEDYMRFCLMILNGGELDGRRILSRKSVELMGSNHMGDVAHPYPWPGYGFGLGFAVLTEPGTVGELASRGELSWDGAAGTLFWIDREEELVGIFMMQVLPHNGLTYKKEFRLLAYQSIAD